MVALINTSKEMCYHGNNAVGGAMDKFIQRHSNMVNNSQKNTLGLCSRSGSSDRLDNTVSLHRSIRYRPYGSDIAVDLFETFAKVHKGKKCI